MLITQEHPTEQPASWEVLHPLCSAPHADVFRAVHGMPSTVASCMLSQVACCQVRRMSVLAVHPTPSPQTPATLQHQTCGPTCTQKGSVE
jgi:hypothetical protein